MEEEKKNFSQRKEIIFSHPLAIISQKISQTPHSERMKEKDEAKITKRRRRKKKLKILNKFIIRKEVLAPISSVELFAAKGATMK